jgi:carbonic anhydrase/acetyltransferase-like protein (isoleucine patch superfamily)
MALSVNGAIGRRPSAGARRWRLLALGLGLGLSSVASSVTPASSSAGPSFVDPTALLIGSSRIHLGDLAFIGPFASLTAGVGTIVVGDETNMQDSVTVDATFTSVHLGDQVILAHGSTVRGPASIGHGGTCAGGASHCPSFVSFNALVDGGTVERDAMVSALARVGPGVRIPSGRKVLPGANVTSQAQVAAKTALVTEADREFMDGVIHVNVSLAEGYARLKAENPDNVRGISVDPGGTAFNPTRNLPTLAGTPTRFPSGPSRIIGDVRMKDDFFNVLLKVRYGNSLRADEGEPFEVGTIASMGRNVTFHALEHSHLHLGGGATYGSRSIVHGGPAFATTTESGEGLRLGEGAVLFQSHVGNGVTIGSRSLVQATDLPDGAVVPPRTVVVGGVVLGAVEW